MGTQSNYKMPQVATDWDSVSGVSAITNKPTLALVSTTGIYADLSAKPNLATITTGTYSATSGVGVTVLTFPHNLGYNPSFVSVTPTTSTVAKLFFVSWDATNITVTLTLSITSVLFTFKWMAVQ